MALCGSLPSCHPCPNFQVIYSRKFADEKIEQARRETPGERLAIALSLSDFCYQLNRCSPFCAKSKLIVSAETPSSEVCVSEAGRPCTVEVCTGAVCFLETLPVLAALP